MGRRYDTVSFLTDYGTADEFVGVVKSVIRDLPIPPAAESVPAPALPTGGKSKKAGASDAVRFVFAGREDEVAALGEMLGEGGPIVVSGPRGMGRTQIVEHAIAASGLTRLPELRLGRGSGFDTLIGRIAEIGKAAFGHAPVG